MVPQMPAGAEMMQDVSERGAMRGEPGCFVFKKAVPPHGRAYAGAMGWVSSRFFWVFFFVCLFNFDD